MKTRQELARHFFTGTGVELGVAAGKFSEEILRQQMLPDALDCVSKLYSIDRWTEDHHGVDEYLRALNRLANYGQRSTVLRATFEEALGLFVDGSLDFVYVDGYAHTGQEGGKTLEDWWPKIKPGGVMAGHDYDPLFQPTIDAVDAFVVRHGLELHLTEEEHLPSWWVMKK